jgi:5-methylcytosine-specific restriction protein A
MRGRCPTCKRRRDQESDARRPSAAKRGYDTKWADFARRWLARFPWCGQRVDGVQYAEHSSCTALGRRELAACVDHIRALRAGGRHYDGANLQSLCGNCNRRKNIKSEGGFGRAPRKGDDSW